VVVPLESESWTAMDLASHAAGPVHPADSLADGLAIARKLSPHGRRCITGSIHLVGAARALIQQGVS
jgi:hypothetical protein